MMTHDYSFNFELEITSQLQLENLVCLVSALAGYPNDTIEFWLSMFVWHKNGSDHRIIPCGCVQTGVPQKKCFFENMWNKEQFERIIRNFVKYENIRL